MLGNICDTI